MAHIEYVKTRDKIYLRIAESYYDNETHKQKKRVVKNLGDIAKYDDGLPDFLERFRNQFKTDGIIVDGKRYCGIQTNAYSFNLEYSEEKHDYSCEYKNLGYFFLEILYNQLGITQLLRDYKSRNRYTIDLNSITKLLVLSRILSPTSKSATYENRLNFFKPIVDENLTVQAVYDTLDVLEKKSSSIQTCINNKIKNSSIGRKTDLIYYDVTNYYFERMYNDDDEYELESEPDSELSAIAGEPVYKPKMMLKKVRGKIKEVPVIKKPGLRKKGVSKENRKEPIVQMGLFIDENDIPVSFDIYSGNTQDKSTFGEIVPKHINPLIESGEMGRVIVVADNGMMAQGNLYLLLSRDNGYIFSESLKRSWNTKNKYWEESVDEEPTGTSIGEPANTFREWVLNDANYDERYNTDGELVFKSKSRIVTRTIKSTTEKDENSRYKTITYKEKQVVFWSKKHYEKEMHEHQKFADYMFSIKDTPAKLKDKQMKTRYVKRVQLDPKTRAKIRTVEKLEIDEEKLKKQEETCGYYLIVTSETSLSDSEIINRYHGLSRIEDSFRVIKSDLKGRPVFVRTREHIKAHFLICFIALTIIRILQHKILQADHKEDAIKNIGGWEQGLTANRIKQALKDYEVATDKNKICAVKGISEDLMTIYNSFNVKYKMNAPTINEINRLISQVRQNGKL